ENVRLFNELQEKNQALTVAHAQVSESLEQQTATSEILRVIAGSPTDLQPVIDVVAESAARFCGATDAAIFRLEGQFLRVAAVHGPLPMATPGRGRLRCESAKREWARDPRSRGGSHRESGGARDRVSRHTGTHAPRRPSHPNGPGYAAPARR